MNARLLTLSVVFVLFMSVPGFAQQAGNGNFDWRSAASDALEEVDRHIESTTNLPKYKANQFGVRTKNQVLKRWRDTGNSIRRKATYITETYGRTLGWAAFLADGPAKALGHWSVGQYEDGSVELANEGIKTFATMGGASVGAGGILAGMKMMGIGGMTIGGPAAGIVGAAIGGVIGAVGGGVIYDGYVSEYVQQLGHAAADLGHVAVRYVFDLPDERTSFEQAQDARHDFLVRQVVEQREQELRRMYGYEGREGEEVLLTDRMTDPAKILGTPPDASKPVIPDACTLTVTLMWAHQQEYAMHWTYRVESGVVTGTANQSKPAESPAHVMNYRDTFTFAGKIENNRITGTETGDARWEVQLNTGEVKSHHSRWNGEFELLLNLDGTANATTVIRGTSGGTAWGPDKYTLSGRWKIRGEESK